MQTHRDRDFMNQLAKRALEMTSKGESEITAGKPNEESLAEWKVGKGPDAMRVVHMPNDPQNILRISVGGGDLTPVGVNYCTIRGGVGQCIKLLEKAIEALRKSPE